LFILSYCNIPFLIYLDIVDIGSAGGTMVNGKLVRKCNLKPGDVIAVGVQTFEFRVKNGNDIFSIQS
jgi:pSer/pThr/pTyr-binding forkhead associated (FHA) protein